MEMRGRVEGNAAPQPITSRPSFPNGCSRDPITCCWPHSPNKPPTRHQHQALLADQLCQVKLPNAPSFWPRIRKGHLRGSIKLYGTCFEAQSGPMERMNSVYESLLQLLAPVLEELSESGTDHADCQAVPSSSNPIPLISSI